jgi:hypothetical protein
MFAESVDVAEHSATLDSAMDGGLSIGPGQPCDARCTTKRSTC